MRVYKDMKPIVKIYFFILKKKGTNEVSLFRLLFAMEKTGKNLYIYTEE